MSQTITDVEGSESKVSGTSDLLNSSSHSSASDNFRLTFDSSDEDENKLSNTSKSVKESAVTSQGSLMEGSKVDDGFEETSSNDTQLSCKISELINGIDDGGGKNIGNGDNAKENAPSANNEESSTKKVNELEETLGSKMSSANCDRIDTNKCKDDESTNLDDEFAKMEEQLAMSCDSSVVDDSAQVSSTKDDDKIDPPDQQVPSVDSNEIPNDGLINIEDPKPIESLESEDVDKGIKAGSKEADSSEAVKSKTPDESALETLESAPASIARTDSQDSEKCANQLETRIEEMDDDSSNSEKFASEQLKGRKRPVDSDWEADSTCTGAKKIRVDKKHCSDGEDEPRSSEKKRRRSYSEDELMKDLNKFENTHPTSLDFKGDEWKNLSDLTEDEMRRIEHAGAREKKMRANVLRLIQQNYKDVTTEALEDTMYVAMMDYFCHYNPVGLLQRKIAMLLKLLSNVQENYNKNFKQFCETKYLLKRLIDIRKEELKTCTCKEKLPFKMIRSVAVQVQTSKCRSGMLCPGTSIGLNPKFKTDTKASTGGKDNKATVSVKKPDQIGNGVVVSKVGDKVVEKARHITVSVPPMQQASKPSPKLRSDITTRPLSELQTPVSPQTKLSRLGNNQVTVSPVTSKPAQAVSKTQAAVKPAQTVSKPQPAGKSQADVIDLTDKDEDAGQSKRGDSGPVNTPTQARIVKTSVLSPMPVLPPLPTAPQYKPNTKRPPQPVLKVCKADQSGIMLSWTLRSLSTNEIMCYQVYACQENSGVTREWNTVGDVKALPLPMACTLSQFREGHRYHFVVRAMDKFKILGEFSHPASILLVSKNVTNTPAITQPSRRV